MTVPQQYAALRVTDFDYDLPAELIAQHPPANRGDSRLLRVAQNGLNDHPFAELPDFVNAGDLLVFNDTRVIKARLFGAKESGGQIEVLVERILDEHEVLAHVRASKSPKPGTKLRLAESFEVEMLGREGELFRLRFLSAESVWTLLDRHGHVPLPPYIEHADSAEDIERYQTIYARQPGAVAAPTAGLHFDETMLQTLQAKGIATAYVTLHVGAGTFQPVRAEHLADHHMHSERYEIPAATAEAIKRTRVQGGKIIAVGTTSLRALEACAAIHGEVCATTGDTDIFIAPGFEFRVVERLLTNFHLPRSTLLMLVSAFADMQRIRDAYSHAIAERYRFFSYGDAMLIDRI
ncbi:MAG TPA: tRNA preQ1(34) S-adenosylmethionine ribosyltransferase-isomerase QueA [Burkholderiales bacterium]|nr:tRNA preQ1(34) S-adenosylmethionine ribosyltransferase-isomerase QueA [Burkholderiales bacterium]